MYEEGGKHIRTSNNGSPFPTPARPRSSTTTTTTEIPHLWRWISKDEAGGGKCRGGSIYGGSEGSRRGEEEGGGRWRRPLDEGGVVG